MDRYHFQILITFFFWHYHCYRENIYFASPAVKIAVTNILRAIRSPASTKNSQKTHFNDHLEISLDFEALATQVIPSLFHHLRLVNLANNLMSNYETKKSNQLSRPHTNLEFR